MKKTYFILTLLLVIFLFGCGESTNSTGEFVDITLFDTNNLLFQTITQVKTGESIELPYYNEEDHVFVGWTDGVEIYYPNYLVTGKLTLTPVLELASEVFEYTSLSSGELILKGYIGEAKYLKIPNHIDGHLIRTIGNEAFMNKNFIEVEIPNSITKIHSKAFFNCPQLKKIAFYGEFSGELKMTISKDLFMEIVDENSDMCEITDSTSDKSWKYSEGCPIKEVISISGPVVVMGEEFYSYNVIFDLKYYSSYRFNVDIAYGAFYQLNSLETVEFSERYSLYSSLIFQETPNLKNILFHEDNPYFITVDDVIYSADMTRLISYSKHLRTKTWTVPDSVINIDAYAFYDNKYLQVLLIGENTIDISEYSLVEMTALKEIIVDENNPLLTAIDGVLYYKLGNTLSLLKYPIDRRGSYYVLPDNVTRIFEEAFAGNKNLKDVILPEGLERIGSGAFSGSKNIKVLTIPSSVTVIGYRAFYQSRINTLILKRDKYVHGSITITHSGYELTGFSIFVPDDSYYDYLINSYWNYASINWFRLSDLQ